MTFVRSSRCRAKDLRYFWSNCVFTKLSLSFGFSFALLVIASGKSPMTDVIAIKEGADLDLNCPIAVASEDMIISWTCDDEPANLKSSRIHVSDAGKLRIRSAKVGDSCNYRCEAANGFGTVSVVIKVIIVDKRLMDQFLNRNHSSHGPDSEQEIEQRSNGGSRDFHEDESSRQSLSASTSPADQENGDKRINDQNNVDLDIQVDPAALHIEKNRTFTLECRVKYARHLPTPQIVWLKEFIGQKPETLNEAHEQSLISIDNIYYHSLNWPRSNTYLLNTSRANSALLVRRSSFVHSGRYICFAGLSPFVMYSNLSLTSPSSHLMRALKYKMAMAVVRVDDPDGELTHMMMLEAANNGRGLQQQSFLLRLFSARNWAQSLTILLALFCAFLYAFKLICNRYQTQLKTVGSQTIREPEQSTSVAINTDIPQSRQDCFIYRATSTTSRPNSSTSVHKFTDLTHMVSANVPKHDDHLYSEIGELERTMTTNSEIDYKVPKSQ